MSSFNLHNSLLRPAVLQMLRAAGFSYTRTAVLDTVTDLAARYLLLLASATAQHASNNHNDYIPTVQDVRLALLEVGAIRPQLSVLEERMKGVEEINGETVPFEDMRGVDGFVNWARGPANKEIRRIAGLAGEAGAGEGLAVVEEEEDYVTGRSVLGQVCSMRLTFAALKKKHSKTGEESRYQGSILGKDADGQNVVVVGGQFGSISEWGAQVRSRAVGAAKGTPASSGISSAPLTPMDEGEDAADEAEVV